MKPTRGLFPSLAAAAALGTLAQPALAASKAAEWLVNEQVAEGCLEGGTGRFAPQSVIERDLTGDGKTDLIVSHDGLECESSGRSGLCGLRACTVVFYVREGTLLRKKAEILSIGVSVGSGNPPVINLVSHDFTERTVRWNGRDFK